MKKTRALFKLALRYCKQHESTIRANTSKAVSNKDYANFWKDVSKSNNSKANKFSNVIDECVGDQEIVERWRLYYEKLYNSCDYSNDKQLFVERLKCSLTNAPESTVTVQDVMNVCQSLKKDKSSGPDGISSEAISFACPSLFVHLSMLFNLFLKFDYLPDSFMQSVIVPLIKNKSANLSDLNNYRAIAISNVFSKIFDSLSVESLQTVSVYDKFQFGFKRAHSTGLCTSVLKHT